MRTKFYFCRKVLKHLAIHVLVSSFTSVLSKRIINPISRKILNHLVNTYKCPICPKIRERFTLPSRVIAEIKTAPLSHRTFSHWYAAFNQG